MRVNQQLPNLGIDLQELLDLSPDVVAVIDDDVHLQFISGGVTALFGYTANEWVGKSMLTHIHRDDIAKSLERLGSVMNGEQLGASQIRIRHANGSWIPVEVKSRRVIDASDRSKLVVTIRNVSERQDLLAQLTWQAAHDDVTGLLSWVGLKERFDLLVESWPDAGVIVTRLDIAGFQRTNEFFGHEFGDAVLAAFAQRLSESVHGDSLVGRLGGDDFVVVQPLNPTSEHNSRSLPASLSMLVHIDGIAVELEIKAGISAVTKFDGVLTGLAEAESALHLAKHSGDSLSVFDHTMRAAGIRRRSLEVALRRELSQPDRDTQPGDHLTLQYQPIVDAVERTVVGFEALARWSRKDGVLIPPAEFVPIAEATGLMVPLGRRLVRIAIETLASWTRTYVDMPSTLAINVSPIQLQRGGFVAALESLFRQHEVPADRVIIEITESQLMENMERATTTLHQLRDLGCSIAIDDFGTGYSSFGYLRDLPADIIKIDRSFIEPLGSDARSAHIVRAIVDLSQRLGFTVIAEGVETATQADMLTAIGVNRLQGYAFGRAVVAADAAQLIVPHPPRPAIRNLTGLLGTKPSK